MFQNTVDLVFPNNQKKLIWKLNFISFLYIFLHLKLDKSFFPFIALEKFVLKELLNLDLSVSLSVIISLTTC